MLLRHGRHLLSTTRDVRNLSLFFGNITAIEGILWYIFPIYFAAALGDIALVGILIATHSLASLLVDIPSGDLIDRIGRKQMFLIGIVGLFVSFSLFLIPTFGSLFFGMLFYGIFSTFYGNAAYAIVLDKSRKHQVGESVGLFSAMSSLGWTIGPLLAGVLLMIVNIPAVLALIVSITLLLAALSFVILHSKISIVSGVKLRKIKDVLVEDKLFLGELRRISGMGWILVPILFFSFTFGFWEYAVWMIEPIYTALEGISTAVAGLLLTLFFAPELFFSMPAGMVTDRIGVNKTLFIGTLLIFVGQIPLFLNPSLITFAVALMVTGVGACFISMPIGA
ncbi:MAG: MFS transporter, partial [Candidatus Micrarchaeota archaeon]